MKIFKQACLATTMMVAGVTAHAQSDDAAGASSDDQRTLGTVQVTADRRDGTVQDTAIAITAFDGDFLEDSNVVDVQDLAQFAPGLAYTKVSNFVQLNMRGIGLEQINLGGEPGVALHVDGVYLARPFVGDAIFSDLDRVEVLRGPQGTLYGRNATGGSVNVVSAAPTDSFEARIGATLGNYDRIRGQAMLSGPLSETVRGRLSVVTDQRGGYLDDLLDNEELEDRNAFSARGTLDFDLSSSATLRVITDYNKETGTGPVFQPGVIAGTAAALGGQIDPDPRRLFEDGPHDQDLESWGVSATLDWDLGGVALKSITAYRDSSFNLISDLDGTDFFLINEDLSETGEQLSQELQLTSTGEGAWQWILGAYIFHEDGTLNYDFPVPLFGTTIRFDAEQETNAAALFGELSFAATDRLTLTGGLRVSHEEKKGSTIQDLFGVNMVDVEDDWTAVTPRFVAEYQANDQTLIYGSISNGFKAGGLNTASLQANAYDPETIWNYEIGVKTRMLNDRLQANVAAFYYEYDDLQVNQFAVGQTFIENAATAQGQGIEIEVAALPSDNLSINASLALLDTEFTDYMTDDSFRPTLGVLDLGGNALPRAPEVMANIVAQYDIPLNSGAVIGLRGEYSYRDDFYFTSFNTDFAEGGGYGLTNARLSYDSPDDVWSAAIFGRNLGDEDYEQTITVSGINAGTLVLYGAPQTYGIELSRRF